MSTLDLPTGKPDDDKPTCPECGSDRYTVITRRPYYADCMNCHHIELYPKHPVIDGKMVEKMFPGDPGVVVYDYNKPKVRKTTLLEFE